MGLVGRGGGGGHGGLESIYLGTGVYNRNLKLVLRLSRKEKQSTEKVGKENPQSKVENQQQTQHVISRRQVQQAWGRSYNQTIVSH